MVSEWPTEPLVYGSDRTGKREKSSSKSSTCSSAGSLEDRVRGTLNALEIRVRGERLQYVKSQLEKNRENFRHQLRELKRLSQGRDNHEASELESDDDGGTISGKSGTPIILSRLGPFRENSRQPYATVKSRKPQIYSKLNAGNVNARKIVFIDVAKLEAIGRLPSYTAWMFVDRNERMTKDQSIARRRRISYESNGKETFYCLDIEEEAEASDGGEERRDIRGLSTSEEFITRMVILEHGSGHRVLETIANFLQVSVAKIESRVQSLSTEVYPDTISSLQPAGINSTSRVFRRRSIYNGFRYQHLFDKLQEDDEQGSLKMAPRRNDAKVVPSNEEAEEETKTSTTLELALDSFDTLFCRRCLVFNCALHDCLEEVLVGVNEMQPPCALAERDQTKPCSPGCRFLVSSFSRPPDAPSSPVVCSSGSAFQLSSSRVSMATEMCQNIDVRDGGGNWEDHRFEKRMATHPEDVRELGDSDREEVEHECDLSSNIGESLVLETARGIVNSREKKKRLSILGKGPLNRKNAKKCSERSLNEAVPLERIVDDAESSSDSMAYKYERKHHRPNGNVVTSSRTISNPERDQKRATSSKRFCSSNIVQGVETEQPPTKPSNKWNRLEQDLCEKGLQIFGRNSCLIAQNVLKGCKSCQEISEYIRKLDNGAAVNTEETSNAHVSLETGTALRSVQYLNTGRGFRPKLRFGRKKVAPKYALGGIRKRIGRDGGFLNLCRQYTPCRCESIIGCGKDCPCVLMNMHCEKYCGCFKVCKNRFRGCQCAKSMCDRRHCPCFAAGRECDPDLCKFCGIECGHLSSQECHNMRILQRKKKRLLLAHSDVCTGWGVFTRHPLHKNDYIGEYTGELISRSEADRRGRIYDRETSFLFNLNDKLVVDAFRKGNKLKFANHSASKANCYAKVLLVGGDHRVGIFAKDKIEAGEELLYDYQYEPEFAPLWATGPD